MLRWFKPSRRVPSAFPTLPDGVRAYAVGDIHGCLSELNQLLEQIEADCANYEGISALVFLGDYVDRGPDSAGVLRHLVTKPLPVSNCVFLVGNHDSIMLDCYDTGQRLKWWFNNGGLETLESYGINSQEIGHDHHGIVQRMREAIPMRDIDFLRSLKSSFRLGDYYFTHAGIRPGIPLEAQSQTDLQWIRDEFLKSNVRHEAMIVHGHTISREAERRVNRIGIDTGCYRTGRLTALVLEASNHRFLQT